MKLRVYNSKTSVSHATTTMAIMLLATRKVLVDRNNGISLNNKNKSVAICYAFLFNKVYLWLIKRNLLSIDFPSKIAQATFARSGKTKGTTQYARLATRLFCDTIMNQPVPNA